MKVLVIVCLMLACGESRSRDATSNLAPPPTLARARAFERGAGVARDYTAAAAIYEQLCRDGRGDAEACDRLLHAAGQARGFDDDASHRRLLALALALCERQHHAVACSIAAMSFHDEHEVPPGLLAEFQNPVHRCDAGDADACEALLGQLDVSGSSGRAARRRDAAMTICAKDVLSGCTYLIHALDDCAYRPGAVRCRDKQIAAWKQDDDRDHLEALAKVDAACTAGDAEACAAIPGREIPRAQLCAAHDFEACAELGCLGDTAAAAVGAAHGGTANCYKIENLEAAREAPVPIEPVADPPPPTFTPADKQPFESLAFRKLAERGSHGWPKFEIYNLGKRRVVSVDVVAYAYDGDGKPIDRSWGMRVTDAIDAGAHVVAEVTDQMREVYPVPHTAVTFDVCYEAIGFDGDPTVYRMRCANARSRGERARIPGGVVAISLHPLLPWEGQYNWSWLPRAYDDALIDAFEKAHTGVMIDSQDGWNRGPLRGGPDAKADIASATSRAAWRADQQAIPVALTAVAIAYHLDGVAALALSPTTIARIFAGEIKMWNDPAIVNDNPGVALPAIAIAATRAISGRPASVALASFVERAAPGVWHVKHGTSWPEGVPYNDFEPGRGDDVRTKNGAVTYLELPAAVVLKLPLARVRNRAGGFVAPTAASTTAAGERVVLDKELFFDPIDAPGKSAYPIVYASWAVTDRKPIDPVRTPWIRAYLAFLLGDGQALLAQGPYGRLPAAVVKRALAAIGKP